MARSWERKKPKNWCCHYWKVQSTTMCKMKFSMDQRLRSV
jgi:hypothetical protein